MLLSRTVKLRPSKTQMIALGRGCAAARRVWNWGLGRKQETWKIREFAITAGIEPAPYVATEFSLSREITQLKRAPKEHVDFTWLAQVNNGIPTQSLRDLDKAYAAWFKRMTQGLTGGRPQFKPKDLENGHFTISGDGISVKSGRIRIPSVGSVCIMPGQRGYIPDGDYKIYQRITVKQIRNHWYATLHVEMPVAPMKPVSPETMVGIDVGCRELCHLSDGTVYETPQVQARHLKRQHKLNLKIARQQRAASKRLGACKKGEKRTESNRLKKTRRQLARVTDRVTNTRTDVLHKVTTEIAKKYSVVVVENLQSQNMTRSVKPGRAGARNGRAAKASLNRQILASGMLRVKALLSYKMPLYGGRQFLMPAAYTSQKCSNPACDAYNNVGSSKIYKCEECGLTIDRDQNASLNLVAAVGKPEATMNLESGTVLPGLARLPVASCKKDSTGGKCGITASATRRVSQPVGRRKASVPKSGVCGIENALGSNRVMVLSPERVVAHMTNSDDPCNQTPVEKHGS